MPEICRFFGIIIYMYYNEHNPAHFHFKYGDFEGICYLTDDVVEGKMPAKVIEKVIKWKGLHEKELFELWEFAHQGKKLYKIDPLLK